MRNFAILLALAGWAGASYGAGTTTQRTAAKPAPAAPSRTTPDATPPKTPAPAPAQSAPAPTPAPPAPADKQTGAATQPAEKLHSYVQVVEKLYQEGQLDAALIAVRTLKDSNDANTTVKSQLAIFEGLLQFDSMQEDQAREDFTRALELNYDAALPSYASNKAVQFFQPIKAEYQKSHQRPPPALTPMAEEPSPLLKNGAWGWIPVGIGAAGTGIGIGILATSGGRESTLGGALLGGGLVSAALGLVVLTLPTDKREGTSVSMTVTPRGDVLTTLTGRF